MPKSAEAKRLDEALQPRIAEDLIAQYIARLQSESASPSIRAR